MKKVIKLLSIVCALVLVLSCAITANAAWQTTGITITEVAKAPAIDGVIDEANGPKQWDQTATDIAIKEDGIANWDLYPREPELRAPFAELYKKMNMKGYFSFDDSGIYLAVEAIDFPPKASSNADKPWYSTNIQVVLYTNSSRNFFTLAYAGTNKANIHNDASRSELDIGKVKDYCVKEEKINDNTYKLTWEVKIPYEALWDVKNMDDIDDMRLGIVQSSMSTPVPEDPEKDDEAYACQAFGEAYRLDYEYLLPVTVKKLGGASTSSKEETSSKNETSSKTETSSKEETASKNETSSKNETTSEIVSAVGSGVDLGGATESETESTVDSQPTESSNTTGEQAPQSNSTLIIILIAVAAVVIIGGVVAIILINKKK